MTQTEPPSGVSIPPSPCRLPHLHEPHSCSYVIGLSHQPWWFGSDGTAIPTASWKLYSCDKHSRLQTSVAYSEGMDTYLPMQSPCVSESARLSQVVSIMQSSLSLVSQFSNFNPFYELIYRYVFRNGFCMFLGMNVVFLSLPWVRSKPTFNES